MIFLTGATGLIGSYVLRELRARGEAVRALYRGSRPPAGAPAGVEWLAGDLLDTSLLAAAIDQDVTHVLHCAGLVSYAPQDEDALLRVNVEGTAAVVDACLRRPGLRLGYVSSVAALGQPAPAETENPPGAGPRPLDETATWDLGAQHSAYATSKYLAELEVWRGVAEGLSAVIVNPSVVLGAGDWHRSSTQLLRYAHGEHRFYTPGYINLVDVRDVVAQLLRLTLKLPEQPTARYILSGGAYPLGEFLGAMARALGRRPPTVAVPDWAAEAIWRVEHLRALLTGARPLITRDTARAGRHPLVYDARRARAATGLGFRPLAETIAWLAGSLETNQPTRPPVVT